MDFFGPDLSEEVRYIELVVYVRHAQRAAFILLFAVDRAKYLVISSMS